SAMVEITDSAATITNGKISCVVSKRGWLEFFKDGKSVLKEYMRDWRGANEHSPSMKFFARDFKAVSGNDYNITMRFEADSKEKIFGMGQYQQPNLNLKGCM
ncbi:MAG: family 31 glucosidase, partial [Clostridia bacterium]|nr:family 31 glucosidase [Clostridia bacterium]